MPDLLRAHLYLNISSRAPHRRWLAKPWAPVSGESVTEEEEEKEETPLIITGKL